MMFVRPASDQKHQNLMAYQHGGHIYYSALRDIEAREELRVSVEYSEVIIIKKIILIYQFIDYNSLGE